MESLYKSWFQFGVVGALSTAILSSAALSPAKAQNNTETLTLSSETNAIEAVDVTTVYGVGSVYTILVVNPALTNSQESSVRPVLPVVESDAAR